jgi:DNA repair exonuclease SbcCD nuclease subunit
MDQWTFAHVTDIHVGSPRSFRFEPRFNENWQTARRQIVEIGPDLLLVGGDVARDGSLHRYELEAVKADLDALPFPCHVIPGNMDTGNKHTDRQGARDDRNDLALNITSGQVRQFASVFGPVWWSFLHKGVRFSAICDMLMGSGLPEEEAQWQWLEAQRDEQSAGHHVCMTHYPLFLVDRHEPNYDITDPGQYYDWYFGIGEPHRTRLIAILKDSGAELVVSGHVHCRKTHRAEGITFTIGPSSAFPQQGDRWEDGDDTLGFMRYDVSDEGIEGTFVPLERVSTASGYGPGGHPLPEKRDYSIAWER